MLTSDLMKWFTDNVNATVMATFFTAVNGLFVFLSNRSIKRNAQTLREESQREHQMAMEAVAQNTGLTIQAATASAEAASVANNLNEKIASTLDAVKSIQAPGARRKDDTEQGEIQRGK